ncbi:MAG: hypothetical protein RLZZ458_618 [Planctomycetota bacterium]|jgi:hypothetical protein
MTTSQPPLRIGFACLDSSHCTAFTRLLQNAPNAPSDPLHRANAQITVGWPGGSPDFPLSRDRVAGFTAEMQQLGVHIAASLDELLEQVDAVILGAVDGRQHVQLARQIFPAGLPVFVDKPLAHNLEAAREVAEIGRQTNTPWFTASALRYQRALTSTLTELQADAITGCDCYGTLRHGRDHLELAWYGIHGLEALYAVMGPGCHTVSRIRTDCGDITVGHWPNGRLGTFRALPAGCQPEGFGLTIFGTQHIRSLQFPATYDELLAVIIQFFRTRRSPVPHSESLEIFAFMHAAEESSRNYGIPVQLDSATSAIFRDYNP